jgi:signal-transduction protein with cAMP-binding, CBS, and nucleotidyltransferase domain
MRAAASVAARRKTMMDETSYKPLALRKATKRLGYQQPATFISVTASSPAIAVMTDLRQVSAATIGAEAMLGDASRTMIARNVRLLLVVAPDQSVVGMITARDTQGERPIQWLHDRGGKYADLRVSDMMTSTEDIELLDIRDVLHAEVGHVVAFLKALGRQHALVAEQDAATGATLVRGIFSATQIGRQLGIAVQPFDVAVTFADIERTLAG